MSAFGRAFALGVEEELIVVDAATLALKHGSAAVLGAMEVPERAGSAHPDTYAALVEVASPAISAWVVLDAALVWSTANHPQPATTSRLHATAAKRRTRSITHVGYGRRWTQPNASWTNYGRTR